MDSEREAPEAGGLQGPGSSSAGEPSLVGRRLGIVIRRAEGRGFEARPGLHTLSVKPLTNPAYIYLEGGL